MKDWVYYDEKTSTYRTKDGTVVAEELVEVVASLADIFYIAEIREKQRSEK